MYASAELGRGVLLAVAGSGASFLGRISAAASRLSGDSAGIDSCVCGRGTGEQTLGGSGTCSVATFAESSGPDEGSISVGWLDCVGSGPGDFGVERGNATLWVPIGGGSWLVALGAILLAGRSARGGSLPRSKPPKTQLFHAGSSAVKSAGSNTEGAPWFASSSSSSSSILPGSGPGHPRSAGSNAEVPNPC